MAPVTGVVFAPLQAYIGPNNQKMILEAFDIVPPPQDQFLGMVLEVFGLVHSPQNRYAISE